MSKDVVPFRRPSNDTTEMPPVWYDIAVCHHPDGTIETWVKGTDVEDTENRLRIIPALEQVIEALRKPYDPEQRGD